jgi:hypothetical protein
VVDRVLELRRKCDDGLLSEEELIEYRTLADIGTVLSLFKAKVRRVLEQ